MSSFTCDVYAKINAQSLFYALMGVNLYRLRIFPARAASLITKFPPQEVFVHMPKINSSSSKREPRGCCISQVRFNLQHSRDGLGLLYLHAVILRFCIIRVLRRFALDISYSEGISFRYSRMVDLPFQ